MKLEYLYSVRIAGAQLRESGVNRHHFIALILAAVSARPTTEPASVEFAWLNLHMQAER